MIRPQARERDLAPWLAFLEATGQVDVTVTADLARLTDLADVDVVVAHTTDGPLHPDQEAALCDFVERGGGFVGLHGTTQAWSASPRYLALVGCPPNGRFLDAELRTRVRNPDHPLTRWLAGPFALREAPYGLAQVQPDCEVLLETDWQYRSVPVAYVRAAGRGRIFYCGAGGRAATLWEPTLQQLFYRAIRYTAGRETGGEVTIGLLGTGAIAAEHAAAIAGVPGLRLGAVCDRSPERLAGARSLAPAATGYGDAAELLADDAVDLVVVSTPPNTHAELAVRALAAGKHVVVEKPLCLTVAEADHMIAAAAAAERTLTVYQSRRWDPDFLAVRGAVAEGRLGDLFHAETFVGGFGHPCGYWHSHQPVSGGVIYDWGSHYIDWLLELFPGRVVQVNAWRQKRVWHDVTNDDQVRILMTFDDGAQAEFLHSDIAAARKPKWYVLGTAGAIVAHWR
ncbi:MAG TPA: ThuA domain-containing protein, partial [Candidatus Dormibacteraeota bacterium]|nr:ThuA domain-containing protein [Candidatus Dormibacteraeota bacterium]